MPSCPRSVWTWQGLGDIEEAVREKDRPGGHCHRGEQGRHRGVRQGRAGVRPRFPDRSAPRAAMSQLVKQKVRCASPRSTVPAAVWWVPSRSVQQEARQAAAAEVWADIEVGKHYTGTVKSMTSYGVFVDIGGVDGMVHISELSWSRIKHSLRGGVRGRYAGCVRHLLRPGEEEDLSGREGPQHQPLAGVHGDLPGGRRGLRPHRQADDLRRLCRGRARRGRPDPHLPDR